MTTSRATPRPEEPVRLWVDVAAISLILAVCLAVYRKIVRLWWMWDDPYHLNLVGKHSFSDLLLSSDVWRAHPSHVYTPMLFISLKVDLSLFGLNARAFYVHQLIAVSASAVLLYAAVRHLLDPIAAGGATLVAMLGPAVVRTVPQLMSRHYFEGLAFALVAVIACARRRSVLSAVSYFLAMLAKEVFVPLPLLLLSFQPRRWRSLLPHGIALLVYSILRIAMLGPRLEAYGYTARPGRWPMVIATAPFRVVGAFIGQTGYVGVVVAVVVCAAIVFLFVSDASKRLVLIAGALVAVVPVLPVSVEMQPRYALVAWLCVAVAAAVLLRRYVLVMALLVLVAGRIQFAHTLRESQRMSDEARVFAAMTNSDLLVLPLTPPATMMELRTLTRSSGRWSYDEQPLCSGRVSAPNLFEWTEQTRSIVRMESVAAAARCESIRSAPLSVLFSSSPERLYWEFGPYDVGSYHIILGDGQQGFEVLRAAGFRLPGVNSLGLRIRYDSPSGWSTYSPDLTINLSHGEVVSWRR